MMLELQGAKLQHLRESRLLAAEQERGIAQIAHAHVQEGREEATQLGHNRLLGLHELWFGLMGFSLCSWFSAKHKYQTDGILQWH